MLPLFGLLLDIVTNNLGSNPIQAIHIRLGDWSLRFLCLTLAVTPIQTMTKWRGMAEYRQMLGLYAFFYATLHVFGYLFVDHAGAWRVIGIDIIESSYIWFGVIAYVIVLMLAITSPKSAKKRLGKNWKKLHRLIYYAAGAAVIHYFWQLKGNLFQPLFYLTIISFLLGFRVLVRLKNRQLAKLMLPKGRPISLEDNE
ncbi:protein-methionine-sulfoxide reductase heme-binding subunit MsrQ [Methylomonas sp.]|uniref:sulfite oxidase heme-binding subunit YedZ n=1 Tax=Methylomonas sp. TaxID=418 RepID=UPI0025E23FF8|nr:protein-methionine-sulfoxide reductase heme-binding subunit MsrQ [Methylomonas sp.]